MAGFSLLEKTDALWDIDKYTWPSNAEARFPCYAWDCVPHEHFRQQASENLAQYYDGRISGH